MPSSHLILCHPLLLLPPIPPSIRVFSNESTLRIRWPKQWSFFFCRLLQIILENRGGTNKQWCSVSLPLTFTISCLYVFFFILSYYLRKTKILFLFPSPVSLIFCCLSPCHVILNKDKIFLSWENIYSLITAVFITIFTVSLMNVSPLFYSSSNWVFKKLLCQYVKYNSFSKLSMWIWLVL